MEKKCPVCDTRNPEQARFCLHCGTALETGPGLKCARCGVGLPAHAKFCFACGTPVSESALALKPERGLASLTEALERLMPRQYVAQLRAAQGRVVGERRIVTILFSDVKGSTAIAESLDPEEVMEIMNKAFEVLIEPIYRYEGTLARLMGDAILAFFGAPIAHEDDPERAARAALDILAGVQRYANGLERERGIRGFNVRVGINTGLVVVGEVGADLRMEYTAMGDAVNLAARMEGAAEPGTILITENTHKHLNHLFETESLGALQVKGKTEPVRSFRLLGLKGAPSLMRDVKELRSTLVGRDTELAQLQNAISALRRGQGNTIIILGEAGLGKTRLVSEARQFVSPGVTWVEGHCFSYAESMCYWVAQQILNGLVGVKAGSPPTEVGVALQSRLQQLFHEQVAEIYPYLARLLDVPLEDALETRLKHLAANVLQERMLQSFYEYIRRESLEQPLALIWEDLHWIDPSSLNLLEKLSPLSHQAPLLLVLVFRPNERGGDDLRQRLVKSCGELCQEIELAPLSVGDSEHLLDNLLAAPILVDASAPKQRTEAPHASILSQETRRLILEKAEGNPFFLEEVLRSLLNTDLAATQGDQTANDLRVPDTLQGVIMARIDSLLPQDKRVLQTASVIGRAFRPSVLASVLGPELANGRLSESLGELCRREFITRHGEEEYVFKHNMTLEVTYNGLLLAQRKELHRQVGEAMEAQFPDRLEELAATLAYHFEKAASHDKAFDYLVRAASRAVSVYAIQEALAYYQQALADPSEKSPARLAPALTGLGDVYYLVGQYQFALEHYEQALRLVQDLHARVALHRKMGLAFEKWGKYDRAVTSFDAGLREMRGMMDAAEAARIYTGLGLVYYRRGELDAALELSALALDLMERQGDEWGIAQACNNLGIVHDGRGEWTQAITFHQRCVSLWENLGEVYGLATSYNNLGLVYHHQEKREQAIERYQQSLRLFEKIGNRHGLARAYDSLSQVYMDQGEKEKAMDYLTKAVAILAEIGVEKSQIVPEMWQSGAW